MSQKLGERICIIGPSSTGKSTLAHRIGKKLNLQVTHLDKLHHKSSGNWIARPKEDFIKDHNKAIKGHRWVIEGNYTNSMEQRFERSDTIIKTEMNRFSCLYRYIRRYLKQKYGLENRYGQPENIDDHFNMAMVWWILQPISLDKKRRAKLKIRKALLKKYVHKIIVIRSFKDADKLLK